MDEFTGDEPAAPQPIDTSVAHPARVYNYWLGGKDNFPADRAAAERVRRARPDITEAVRENRDFMQRAAAYLARLGVLQFLDIGSGIPASPNLHEVAQGVSPASRVVYVDHDPVVLAHSRALLASSPEGRTAYIQADMRDPAAILAHPGTRKVLDFTRPVAVCLVSVLWLLSDDEDPYGIVAALMDAVPPGSCLVVSHPALDIRADVGYKGLAAYNKFVTPSATLRDSGQVTRFFEGLDLVPPGVTQCQRWMPADAAAAGREEVAVWAGVGLKA